MWLPCHVRPAAQPHVAAMNSCRMLQELKILMAQHGGVFENYYHRSTVTHIICSNLTDQKVKLFAKER